MAVTGEKLSTLTKRMYQEFGEAYMAEYDWPFEPEQKQHLLRLLMEEKKLPVFTQQVKSVSYMDGVKVTFADGWMIIRFSGTEPRLRVFCEMPDRERAEAMCMTAASFLGLNM